MPLTKEVFFRNKKRAITFLSKEEMLEKIELFWLSESARKDPVKKQTGILKNINWFQKIKFGNKEYFVEKSDNPLKVRENLIDKEDSGDSPLVIFLFSLIPVCVFPVMFYHGIKNIWNKNKVKKQKPVYLENISNNMSFYAILFMLVNFFALIGLMTIHSMPLYLSIVALNLISGLLPIKYKYMSVENYDLMDFRLEENELEEMNGIDAKILNMKGQEVNISNKKIEYDFMTELANDKSLEKQPEEKDSPKSLKKFL